MKNKALRIVTLIASIAVLIVAAKLIYDSFRPDRIPVPTDTPTPTPTVTEDLPVSSEPDEIIDPIGTPDADENPAMSDSAIPVDKLVITPKRQRYTNNAMTIVIPRLSYQHTVGNGTSEETLKIGPGLYDYAQMPDEDNHNVSIAAHRRKSDFYYLDEMTTDDFFYIVYDDNIYRYIYENTVVVVPSDWSPIYSKGYSLLTLTTCTPIGISDHRMIVTATLDTVFPYSDNFDYVSSALELTLADGV